MFFISFREFIKHSRIWIKKMIFEGGWGVKKMNFGGFIHPWAIVKLIDSDFYLPLTPRDRGQKIQSFDISVFGYFLGHLWADLAKYFLD